MATGPRLILDIDEKRFPDAPEPLFSGLQLDVAPSSVVALIGPSGIGKSTLLRMIAGIDREFAGSISIDDLPPAAAPTPGFVFQDPRLLPWLNAADNIRAANPQCTAEQAGRALEQVGLSDVARLYPHQLSGGMQRRVALARALSVNARLLLLDEPFVSLDRILVTEIQALFASIFEQTRPTVVFVSHLADDAVRLADRAILLDSRPATVLADIFFPLPPAQRDATILADYRRMLDDELAAARFTS